MADQRGRDLRFDGVTVGDELPPQLFPLPLHRLVLAAGTTYDLSPMHHNAEYARSSGAPDAYANTLLLLGLWERLVRDFVGPAAALLSIRGFRMNAFVPAGSLVETRGLVVAKDGPRPVPELAIEVRSNVGGTTAVGPGIVRVRLAHP